MARIDLHDTCVEFPIFDARSKSTLLRVMAGIYEPTRSTARISGIVAPVFDLGVGMDPDVR